MNEKILGLKRNTVSNPYIVLDFPDLDFIKKIKRNDTFFLSFFKCMKAWGTRWPLCSRPGLNCWWHRGHLAGCWLVCIYFSLSCLICNASIHLPIWPIRPSLIPPADLSATSSTDVQRGGALPFSPSDLVSFRYTRLWLLKRQYEFESLRYFTICIFWLLISRKV